MRKPFKRSTTAAEHYELERPASFDDIITMARALLRCRFRRGKAIEHAHDAAAYLCLQLAHLEREVFCVLFLDTRHRVLAFEEVFQGSIDSANVYPREIVKRALAHNAAAVILAHNHPSGVAEPSRADWTITQRLKSALAMVDVRVLDHLVVAGGNVESMAKQGLI